MATGLTAAGGNALLNALVAAYPWVKLHTGDPGASAANNAAANATRHQAAFAAASGGAITNSGDVVWSSGEVTTTETYTHASGWSASSAGSAGWTATLSNGAVTAGTEFTVETGDLDISLTLAS